MNDWTAGYVADIGYTFGYYLELNPQRVKLVFNSAGLVCPEFGTACELGFGQGLSANVHAAASVVQWIGTDFNPAQAGFAQELASVSGSDAKLFDQAFAEFATRADLPDFDYIGLHGIWSWISDENRAVIVDFIRRKLKVGGVLYISYNTQPGWATMVPMRDLLTQHAEVMGASGHGIVPRIDAALSFADKLFATNPAYTKANPQVVGKVEAIKGQNRNYVAHEYFNRDWKPMSFAAMAEWLQPAKLDFACSANFIDFVDGVNLTPEQQALLKEIPDTLFRQSVRDFMVNQMFRKDYWVKGARKLSLIEQGDSVRSQRVMLISHRPDVSLKFNAAMGEATMSEAIYAPILDTLADHKPKTIGQIEHAVKDKGISFAQLNQAILVLGGAGHLYVVQTDADTAKAKKRTEKLNTHLVNKARSGGDITYLASPVTGGGVSVSRFQQLFLMAYVLGKKQPAEWAAFAWQMISTQGQKIVKTGAMLQTPEENLAELNEQAQAFATKQLAVMKALQII